MSLFYVNPRYEPALRQQGLRSPDDFLICSDGVTVGRHASRHVRRLAVGDYQIFLKREHPVSWKDRFESWRWGFGWISKSQREWHVLLKMRERGLPCPEPLAVGSVRNMAFLVVRGYCDCVDLPHYLAFRPSRADRHCVLRHLGHAVADLHNAGFTHPDLYAKHIFIHRPTLHVSFVDFQRTRCLARIAPNIRYRELARLDASLHPGAVPFTERLTFLHAYLHRSYGHVRQKQVREAAAAISAESRRLLRRSRIRAMYAETAMLAGEVSTVTYCRIRVPASERLADANSPLPPLSRGGVRGSGGTRV
jgi:tRNA A-37 threonylcarbamoyl transferase component Bud32